MTQIKYHQPGLEATLRGVGEKVYWAYPTFVVQDTDDLIALYMPAGVIGMDTEHKPTPDEFLALKDIHIVDTRWKWTDVLYLIVPGEPFSIYLMWDTGTQNLRCWYINLQEPIRRTSIGYDTMDQMLDVVISPDMSEWQWKDDDEFAEAEKVGFYSHEEARQIWSNGENAIRLITLERRSMYEKWKNWQPDPSWGIPILSPLWDKLNPAE